MDASKVIDSRQTLMDVDAYKRSREAYHPTLIRYLLVAEAPPKDSERFFYFEGVQKGDSLFLEIMKVLYPKDYSSTAHTRLHKREFLQRFMNDGFYLEDVMDYPMPSRDKKTKLTQLTQCLPVLRTKLQQAPEAKIILLSAPVYQVCAATLKAEGYNIINTEMLDFPGSGAQKRFRTKFSRLLAAHSENRDCRKE